MRVAYKNTGTRRLSRENYQKKFPSPDRAVRLPACSFPMKGYRLFSCLGGRRHLRQKSRS